MIYINAKMKEILQQSNSSDFSKLSPELKKLVDLGFIKIENMTFFKETSKNLSKDMSFSIIIERYGDKSGFEYSINGVNIENYIDNKVFEQSYLFFKYFKKKWIEQSLSSCIVVLTFDINSEHGDKAKLSFYLNRLNENVIDIINIESYEQPIMIELINTR